MYIWGEKLLFIFGHFPQWEDQWLEARLLRQLISSETGSVGRTILGQPTLFEQQHHRYLCIDTTRKILTILGSKQINWYDTKDTHNLRIQTHEKFTRTLFIRIIHNISNFRGNPLYQATIRHLTTLNGDKQWKISWRAKTLICFWLNQHTRGLISDPKTSQ